jgi:hypothetical protein
MSNYSECMELDKEVGFADETYYEFLTTNHVDIPK